jgi:hypothetical protein
MKPTALMWQMKALLHKYSRPNSLFKDMFLLCLPSDMRDHLISKDFKDCTLMAEYSHLLHSSRASCAVAAVAAVAVNAEYEESKMPFLVDSARTSRQGSSGESAAC